MILFGPSTAAGTPLPFNASQHTYVQLGLLSAEWQNSEIIAIVLEPQALWAMTSRDGSLMVV
ncbi:hypothetical protein I8F73_04330 [Enterococcus faecalis]|nr:hypothetical protein [Enterococcus faecalis]